MAEKRKRPVGRPRKVVDNTVKKDDTPDLNGALTWEQKMIIGKTHRALAEIMIPYIQLQHPSMDNVIQLNEAFQEFKELYNEVWNQRT